MIRKEKINKSTRTRVKLFDTTGDYAFVPYKLKKFCVAMSKIKLLEKNPRINDAAAEKLAILIKENGFRKPIVINQKGFVMAGNTAYKAARILGMKFIPVAESDFYGEADSMRYVISDNKASEYSTWDTDLLKELIEAEALNDRENINGLGLTDANLKSLFEIKKESVSKKFIEVIVSVNDNAAAEKLVNHLQMHEYKCRVIHT